MSTNSIDTEIERINRLKVVLVEQNRKGKWLAKQLGKNKAIASRWCSNASQPSSEMLVKSSLSFKLTPANFIMTINNFIHHG